MIIAPNEQNLISVAKLGATHGIKGFLKLQSFTSESASLFNFQNLIIRMHDLTYHPIKIKLIRAAQNGFIVSILGSDSIETSSKYVNCELFIKKNDLPALRKDEFYWHDVIGYKVINKENEDLGSLIEAINTGSNDIMVVQGEKRHLIPYIYTEFVLDLNDETKTILVDWDKNF